MFLYWTQTWFSFKVFILLCLILDEVHVLSPYSTDNAKKWQLSFWWQILYWVWVWRRRLLSFLRRKYSLHESFFRLVNSRPAHAEQLGARSWVRGCSCPLASVAWRSWSRGKGSRSEGITGPWGITDIWKILFR